MKLRNCPRCHGSHDDLLVEELDNPVVDPKPYDREHPCTFHYWSMCPVRKQPILFISPALDDILITCKPPEKEIQEFVDNLWEKDGKPEGKQKEYRRQAEYCLTKIFRIPSESRFMEQK
jgi:hypothetical protein